MEWFTQWWLELGLVGQIMACSAIPMTVVMLLQLVLMIIGVGPGGDSDSDFDDAGLDGVEIDDGGFDSGFDSAELDDAGFDDGFTASDTENLAHEAGSNSNSIWRIFTIRGIVAFFALGGWAGLAALTAGVPVIWSIWISLFAGIAAMMLASIAIRLALRMQDSGNINLNNALSQTADVYITIPPQRERKGKVTMTLQERFVELDAVTDSETEIRTNSKVEVVGLADKDCLVVRMIETDKE